MSKIKNYIKILVFGIIGFFVRFYKSVDYEDKKRRFKKLGNKVTFNQNDFFNYENISIGNSVRIGTGAFFIAKKSEIILGSKILIGPNVTLVGGNHSIYLVGQFIYDVDEKNEDSDNANITIEDDVWIGVNVTILRGVTIGRGSVVGAGSVVTKSIPPYSIAVGVPVRIIKKRFSIEDTLSHERMLYPEHDRLCRIQLEKFFDSKKENWERT